VFPVELFVEAAVAVPPVPPVAEFTFLEFEAPPDATEELLAVPPEAEFVELSVGETLLVLELEFALLLCELAFELLLLDEPLDETFWFDVFCVSFTEVVCD
jgi:hypothetical protein